MYKMQQAMKQPNRETNQQQFIEKLSHLTTGAARLTLIIRNRAAAASALHTWETAPPLLGRRLLCCAEPFRSEDDARRWFDGLCHGGGGPGADLLLHDGHPWQPGAIYSPYGHH